MFQRYTINLKTVGWRKDYLHGRLHYVVPTASLAEGVWTGSQGPVFYPKDEIVAGAPTWNHKPIVVYHPEKGSACDPIVLNTRAIGLLLNTTADDKLKHESWIDVERAREVDKRIVEAIENNETVEVSTGLYTGENNESGEWNGKKYDRTARNQVGDHLAVLPDRTGAFSVKDGGGLLVNQGREPERTSEALKRSAQNILKAIGATFEKNELSFSQISTKLCDLLASKFGEPGKYWPGHIYDTYDNYVIFCNGYGYDSPMMKISYTKEADNVALVGEAEEVQRVIDYQPVGNSDGKLEEKDMADKFDRAAHLDTLLANGYEDKKEWLQKLSDDVLKEIKPLPKEAAPANNEKPAPKDPPVLVEPKPAPPTPGKSPTFEELLNTASPEVREQFQDLQSHYATQKESLIEEITNNEQNIFTKEHLQKKSMVELRGLAALARKPEVQQMAAAPDGTLTTMFSNHNGPIVNYQAAAGRASAKPENRILPLPSDV